MYKKIYQRKTGYFSLYFYRKQYFYYFQKESTMEDIAENVNQHPIGKSTSLLYQ